MEHVIVTFKLSATMLATYEDAHHGNTNTLNVI